MFTAEQLRAALTGVFEWPRSQPTEATPVEAEAIWLVSSSRTILSAC